MSGIKPQEWHKVGNAWQAGALLDQYTVDLIQMFIPTSNLAEPMALLRFYGRSSRDAEQLRQTSR
jgi:hypothetical protein